MKALTFLVCFLSLSPLLFANPYADPVDFDALPKQAVRFEPPFAKRSTKTTALAQTLPVQHLSALAQQVNQAIMRQQWQRLPTLLQAYQQQPNYDLTLVHYALGVFYYAQQQYPQAITHYQAVVEQYPQLAYPRFDLGVILAENHQYKQATTQLTLAKSGLAPQTQSLAEYYLAQIAERQDWQPEFNLQYIRTNNVNNASSSPVVNLNGRQIPKDQTALPQSAEGVRYGIGLSKTYNLSGNHYLNSSLSYSGVYYWDNRDYSEQSLRFSAGYQYRSAKMSVGVSPFIEQNWLGSSRYSQQFGLSLHSFRQLTSNLTASMRLTHSQKRYQDNLVASRYNGFQNNGALMLHWQAVKNGQFFARFDVNREQALEKASSSHKFGGTFGMIYRWRNWETELSGGYAKRFFEGDHYLYLRKRTDQEYRINWALTNTQWAWKGFTPKLHFNYLNIRSNMPDFYSRKNHEWFITVEKLF